MGHLPFAEDKWGGVDGGEKEGRLMQRDWKEKREGGKCDSAGEEIIN